MIAGRDIVALRLTNNQITHILADAFSGLDFVRTAYDNPELNLSGNNLMSIDCQAFRSILGHFSKIVFRNCALTELPIEALRDIPTLTYIPISRNHITDIPDSTFKGFPELVWLVFERKIHLETLTEKGCFLEYSQSWH